MLSVVLVSFLTIIFPILFNANHLIRIINKNFKKFGNFFTETFLENTKEHRNDSDDTIIIENYLNGSQDDIEEGRYIEEYVALEDTENCEDVITEIPGTTKPTIT